MTNVSEEQIDRLSDLPEHLLLVLLSLLPTDVAARISVLSCRFHHIWVATHLTEICYLHRPNNMDYCALHVRGTSYPLIHLTFHPCRNMIVDDVVSLLRKAQSLGLRHLKVHLSNWHAKSILPIIFSFDELLSLSFDNMLIKDGLFSLVPSNISLTRLKTLSLSLYKPCSEKLNEVLAKLYSLENLFIKLNEMQAFKLMSHTVRTLRLTINNSWWSDIVRLSMPNLDCLDIEMLCGEMPCFLNEMPQLRKAFLSNHFVYLRDCVRAICDFLKKMRNTENLKLDLSGCYLENCSYDGIEDPWSEPPIFHNLKALDLILCFREKNMEYLIRLLHNCPLLESLNLIHKGPHTRSMLPRNPDGNNTHAYFCDLHLEDRRKQLNQTTY